MIPMIIEINKRQPLDLVMHQLAKMRLRVVHESMSKAESVFVDENGCVSILSYNLCDYAPHIEATSLPWLRYFNKVRVYQKPKIKVRSGQSFEIPRNLGE